MNGVLLPHYLTYWLGFFADFMLWFYLPLKERFLKFFECTSPPSESFCYFFALFLPNTTVRVSCTLLSVSRCIICYLTTIGSNFLFSLFALSRPMSRKCSQKFGSLKFGSRLQPDIFEKPSISIDKPSFRSKNLVFRSKKPSCSMWNSDLDWKSEYFKSKKKIIFFSIPTLKNQVFQSKTLDFTASIWKSHVYAASINSTVDRKITGLETVFITPYSWLIVTWTPMKISITIIRLLLSLRL